MLKSIKELAPNPSDALQAMVDGLREQSKREDFIIDMGWFVGKEDGICCGCAATCALQRLAGVNFTIENSINANRFDLLQLKGAISFESVIDDARQGYMSELFGFYGFDRDSNPDLPQNPNFDLETDNWEEQLPDVEAYIAELRAAGY